MFSNTNKRPHTLQVLFLYILVIEWCFVTYKSVMFYALLRLDWERFLINDYNEFTEYLSKLISMECMLVSLVRNNSWYFKLLKHKICGFGI